MIGLLSSCALGAAVGAQHALEPDHLAAVTTMVADHPRRAAWMGAVWGLGHAVALMVIGSTLIAARTELPATAAAALELTVAVMLVALGVRNLLRAWRTGGGPVVPHRHGDRMHSHGTAIRSAAPPRTPFAPAARAPFWRRRAIGRQGVSRRPDGDAKAVVDHVHVAGVPVAVRPLVVGLIHGLAGSGGLAALAAARMPSTATALAYIALFGAGSIAGMAMVSGAFGVTLGRLVAGRTRVMVAATGAVSIACGLAWGWAPIVAIM